MLGLYATVVKHPPLGVCCPFFVLPKVLRVNFRVNYAQSLSYNGSMHVAEQLDSVTIERLRKQGEFLLRLYRAELAKDPTSRATESSRSNVLAVQDTFKQMYGEAVVRDVANLSADLGR
jgi:hypothetical protein